MPANVGGVDGEENPLEALTPGNPFNLSAAMDDIYPRPTLLLSVPTNPLPAAGHVVVSFPDTKANLDDIIAPYKMAQDTIISGSLNGSVLTIDFVAPYLTVSSLGIVSANIWNFSRSDAFPVQ